jgi:hypothetical protein
MRTWAFLIVIAVVALLLVMIIAPPPRPGSHTRAFLGIVNTLRQIDAAKEELVIEHKAVRGSTVSRDQLLPYIPEKYWDIHADYHINAIGVPAEAVLPSRYDGLPAKTIIRFQTNSPGYKIIPPN